MKNEGIPQQADQAPGAPHPRETTHLFGQDEAEHTFLQALHKDRLHHAWMITGPSGIGKATLAWRIARHMISGEPHDSLEMSTAHPVFSRVAALSAPEIFLCRREWDAKTKRQKTAISVDEVRALKSFFQMSSADTGWRIAIVDALDEMSAAAANALLKILEEPPDRALMILVCHRPSAVLPTIRSRCRNLRCRELSASDLGQAMRALEHETDPGVIATLNELAHGSVGTALELQETGGLAIYDSILGTLRTAPGINRQQIQDIANQCAGRDADATYKLTRSLALTALSRLSLAGAGREISPVSETEAGLMSRFGESPDQARIIADNIVKISARAENARRVNLDPAQVILDMFIEIDTALTDALRQAA